MQRILGFFLRLLLIAAFVPILIGASVGIRPALMLVFVVTVGMAWTSLHLWRTDRGKPWALILATAICAAIWALAFATMRR